MSVIEKLGGWFRTESFLRRESSKWARLHFQTSHEEVARAVGYALVEMLGVDFRQLTPSTNIVADLGADEWAEWAEIQMCLEEDLACYFALQPGFSGRTIAELVDFVAAYNLPRPSQKPKRGILSSTGWCLSECLK